MKHEIDVSEYEKVSICTNEREFIDSVVIDKATPIIGETLKDRKTFPGIFISGEGPQLFKGTYISERIVNISDLESTIASAYMGVQLICKELENDSPSISRIKELSDSIKSDLQKATDFEFCIERRNTVTGSSLENINITQQDVETLKAGVLKSLRQQFQELPPLEVGLSSTTPQLLRKV